MGLKTREIPYGDVGTGISIDEMRRLVETGRAELKNIYLARQITQNDGPRDYRAHVASLYTWVQKRIPFRRDPVDVELLQDLQSILAQPFPSGDCDEKSVAFATLVECIGIPTRFVTSRGPNGDFAHVYVQVEIPDEGWITADTTREQFALGDESVTPFGKKIWRRNTMGDAFQLQPDPQELQWPPVTWRENSMPVNPAGRTAVMPGWPELPLRSYRVSTNNILVTGAKHPQITSSEGTFSPNYGLLGAEAAATPSFWESLVGSIVVGGAGYLKSTQDNKTLIQLNKEKLQQQADVQKAAIQAQLDAARSAGNLNNGGFLGLPTWSWIVIGLGVAVIGVGAVVLIKRKK